jgi:hypothetical protein
MRISNNHIMVRPTLIVGLGGTGTLVCQWLEEFLRNVLGVVPPFVRFLKLDTDALEEGGPPNAGRADFINLFQHLDIGAVVRDCARYPDFHPHLDWFKPLGDKLDAVFADYGCQGIPRLGRLVFAELRESVIHQAVSTRFSELRAASQVDMKGDMEQFEVIPGGAPAVHIAGSVCGGTGAGLLIDMAYNLRWWSREAFPRSAEVVGHLMLPEAFMIDPMLRPKLRAVAAATLEQIEFLSDPRRDDIPVRYQGGAEQCFDRLTAPFNFLYLVNGQGDLGVGNRKHLVKMVAQVIQSMTLEPASKLVASESNNKLADALGLYDPASGRRQCFASYGMWYGVPGHDHGNIAAWLGSHLEKLSDEGEIHSEDYASALPEQVDSFLETSATTTQISRLNESFQWQAAESDLDVVADVLEHLEEYFKNSVTPYLQNECEVLFPTGEPHHGLLQAILQRMERIAFEDMLPLHHLTAYQEQLIHYLESWCKRERPVDVSPTEIIKGRFKQKVRKTLMRLAKRIGSASEFTPDDINPVIGEITDQYWPSVVQAFLQEALMRSVTQLLKVLYQRKQAVESLVALASAGQVRSMAMSVLHKNGQMPSRTSNGTKSAVNNHDHHCFSTPLDTTADPTCDAKSALGRSFRQRLIKPLLQDVILSIETAGDSEGGSSRQTTHRLGKSLYAVRPRMHEFLEEVKQRSQREFYEGAPSEDQATRHRYFKQVTDIYKRAAPKVDLDRANKYAKPLHVTISQHTSDCCVSDLLSHSLGANFREATVSKEFEKKTGWWFQLLRFNYGFCLEALSSYEEYRAAIQEYVVHRTRFSPSNMWLNDLWYADYLRARDEWKQQKSKSAGMSPEESAWRDQLLKTISTLKKSLGVFFQGLPQGVHNQGADGPTVIEVTRIATLTGEHIEAILNRFVSLDRTESQKGCIALRKSLDDFFNDLRRILGKGDLAETVRTQWDKTCEPYVSSLSDVVKVV